METHLNNSTRGYRRRWAVVTAAAAIAVAAFAAAPGFLHAQFRPIPNYVGIGAGQQFRNDINNHLSGVTPIAPRMVSLPLAQLPTEQDGQLYWCADCRETDPCAGGGSGALAIGLGGQWSCTSGASVGGAFPLTANVSAGGYRITTLAANSQNGDALSQAQSHLNDLAAATGPYNMNGNTLIALPAAASPGNPLSYLQTGAILDGLGLDGAALTNMAAGTALGQGLAWGQSGAQLTVNQPTGALVSQSNIATGLVTTATIAAPATIANGDALIAVIGLDGSASETITAPSGFTLIRQDVGNGMTQATYCKIAASESGNYAFSWNNTSYMAGGIAVVSGITCTGAGGNGATGTGANTLTVPAFTVGTANDFVLDAGTMNGGVAFNGLGVPAWNLNQNGASANYFSNPGMNIPAITFTEGAGFTANAVAQTIVFATTTTVADAPVVNGQNGVALGGVTAQVNKVLNVMAAPYNAQGDGITDDSGAIQQAIYDACGGSPPFTSRSNFFNAYPKPTVYLPATPNGFAIYKPLRVPCPYAHIKLDPGAKFVWGFGGGDTFIVEGWGADNLTYGPALVGATGQSLSGAGCQGGFPSNTNCGPIDLDRYLNRAGGQATFATASANGFDIEFWMKALDTGSYNVLSSGPSGAPASVGSNGMFSFYDTSGTTLTLSVNTTGGLVSMSCSGLTLTNATDIALDWDKSNYRLFAGGTLCQTVASTNAPVMNIWENAFLPDRGSTQQWGGSGGYLGNEPLNGYLDSVRFENQSLHTASYTPPTAKFTTDGNTFLLLNWPASLDGTQAAQGPNGATIYLTALNENEGAFNTNNTLMEGGELCGGTIPNGNADTNDGLFVAWSPRSTFRDMSCNGGDYLPFDFSNNDFFVTVENNWAAFGHAGFNFGNAFNSSLAINNASDSADLACFIEAGNEFFEDYNNCTDRGALYYYELVTAAFGGGTIGHMFADAEAGNTRQLGGLKIQQIGFPVLLDHDEPNTRNGAPFFVLDPSSASVTLLDPAFDTYGESVGAADLVQFTSAPGAGSAPVNIIGGNPFPSGVPISNYPAYVQVVGAKNALNSLELRNVPTFDAGLNHVTVNAIADPAAPAITVQGATGTTTYGPYYVVCHDANGGVTNASPSSNTVANGPAALSSSDYIQIAWTAEGGCAAWDVLKGAQGTALVTGLAGSATSVNDTGQATTSYVPPARNTTGDVAYGSILVSVGMPYAKIPTTVLNGGRFYCSDCDPPANPPATCTHIGTKTGSWVDGINNQWLCVP